MASGTKNYFRHSFNARNDSKLVRAINMIGPEAYFFYFTLIEMICIELDGEHNKEVEFHSDYLKKEWGVNIRGAEKALRTLHEVSLIELITLSEELSKNRRTFGKVWSIFIPNLSKYYMKYMDVLHKSRVKKRKEKKRKEKKKKTLKTTALLKELNELLPNAPFYIDATYKKCDAKRLDSFINDYGQEITINYLEKIHNYMASAGKEYKCITSTMRNWCRNSKMLKKSEEVNLKELFPADPEDQDLIKMDTKQLIKETKEWTQQQN